MVSGWVPHPEIEDSPGSWKTGKSGRAGIRPGRPARALQMQWDRAAAWWDMTMGKSGVILILPSGPFEDGAFLFQ